MQLIFSPDDVSGMCYEHSPAEAIALVQVIEKALESMKTAVPAPQESTEPESTAAAATHPPPRKLSWRIDPATRQAIQTATIDLDRWTGIH